MTCEKILETSGSVRRKCASEVVMVFIPSPVVVSKFIVLHSSKIIFGVCIYHESASEPHGVNSVRYHEIES